MRIRLCISILCLVGAAMTGVSAATELTRGAMLGNSCAGCHGTDGHSPGAIPSIGGKSAEFIATAMKEFRSGERQGTVMNRHAEAYSDEEIRLIAEFFAREAEQ